MRVLHIITGLGIGGAEQQLRLLLRKLPAECEVVTLTNPGPVAGQLRADGVRVVHLGMGGNRDLRALPRLTRFIARGGYDLVHTHLYRACVYGRLAARLARVPSLATEHSLGEHHMEGRPLTRGNRALYLASERLGHGTVAVSATVARRLADWGVPGQRIHVVPNGIDSAAFRFDPARRHRTRSLLGIAPEAYVVGAVGRLVPGKRFDLLLRAVAEVPEVRLLLVGDGPERRALEDLAGALGIRERVRLAGECGIDGDGVTVPGVLAAMDAFVSTSLEEAFGLAVVEALAAGLPVLHTACPALDDLPPEATAGARRVGADPAELAARLRELHAAGSRRVPRPAAVGTYDVGGSADRLMDIYADILRRTKPAPAFTPTPTTRS